MAVYVRQDRNMPNNHQSRNRPPQWQEGFRRFRQNPCNPQQGYQDYVQSSCGPAQNFDHCGQSTCNTQQNHNPCENDTPNSCSQGFSQSHSHGSCSHNHDECNETASPPKGKAEGSIFGFIEKILGNFHIDSERTLLVFLLIILAKDGADMKLLLALGYLLM